MGKSKKLWSVHEYQSLRYVCGADTLSSFRCPVKRPAAARVHVSDRICAVGEMRLRGLSNFAASTAEWLGGIGWELR